MELRIPKKALIDSINEVKPLDLKPYVDEKIEAEIDQALDHLRETYNIWITYEWDYQD